MPAALATALVLVLTVLLAVVSAVAGALWRRSRSVPSEAVHRLARELASCRRALDAVVARLDKADRSKAGPEPTPEVVVQVASAAPRAAPAEAPAAHRRDDRAEPQRAHGPTLIAVPDLTSTVPAEPPAASAELARKYAPIWEMADSGASAESIARALGQPIGQVELILGLRRSRPTLAAAEGRP